MKNFNFIFLFLFIGSFTISAQSGKQKRADKLYNDLAYIEAVDVYKDLIENDHNSVINNLKLGDSYMKLRSPENAVFYYGDALTSENISSDGISSEYYFKYAQALRGVKRYDESREWLQKYKDSEGNSETVSEMLSKEIADFEIKDEYTLSETEFNSGFSDFGAFEQGGKIYFVSARNEGDKKSKIYSWNGEPFLDIYQMTSGIVSPVQGDVNTVLHDGPVTISKDGQTMFFNRNNYINNKRGKKDGEKTINLKIYKATLNQGKWENVVELPFNNNNYSVGHPSLSPDGKTLYFVSDMPGGSGGTDIYKVEILANNTFGTPVNLGDKINTSLDESFPFLNNENVLYFSSNGHLGYGMLDIFKANLNEDEVEVKNLGSPVNSNMDDFAYFQSSAVPAGYFSTNRLAGNDDIFGFNLLKPLVLKGQVTDAVNKKPIADATVRLMNSENEQIAFLETDEDGNYETVVNRNQEYPIEAKHIEYIEKQGVVNTSNMDDKTEVIYNLELDPVADVEYLAEINNIYFDFDKFNIRPDAALELDKLINLMKNDYPELIVEIRSHTDKRGSNQYNEGLAERRAKATYDYMIANGIAPERIQTYKGYGETKPAIECERCNKTEHQLNRRSMFSVVKMN